MRQSVAGVRLTQLVSPHIDSLQLKVSLIQMKDKRNLGPWVSPHRVELTLLIVLCEAPKIHTMTSFVFGVGLDNGFRLCMRHGVRKW